MWDQNFSQLKDTSKMAVFLDTGAVSRGNGNTGSNRKWDIRKEFVENDLVEAILVIAGESLLQRHCTKNYLGEQDHYKARSFQKRLQPKPEPLRCSKRRGQHPGTQRCYRTVQGS